MVSMKDIAEKCGVSVATVSKALNNHSDIGAATKNKIQKSADEMGYLPNAAARTLKTNRTYSIGVLFVDDANSGLTHQYFSRVLEAFKVQAERQGYDITFINTNIGNKRMTYYEHCRYRNMDGVVIACVDFDNPDVLELVNSDVPVVTIDHIFNNCTAVISDNVKGIEDLVQYIYDKGHRKIAYIHGQDYSSVTKDRLTSFYRKIEQLGLTIPDEYILEAIYLDTVSTAERTAELLSLEEPPTCIIYPDDTALIGGMNKIMEKGLRIPDDISIAGYDGTRTSQILSPKITTIKQDAENIGKQAALRLITLIEKPKTTLIERVVVGGTVVEGDSVKQLPQ
ncbi:ribose operon repressor [Lachnospiraceae bacterium KM106-2]|nr:ribose operon repressor [Lachnospiraceae bacterium KM106-2]